jgi:hypothetical protein
MSPNTTPNAARLSVGRLEATAPSLGCKIVIFAKRNSTSCLSRAYSTLGWEGDYPRKDTNAALAAGTSTGISRPVERTSSFNSGAHLPNSSTLAPPSVTPAVAPMAGPASRSMASSAFSAGAALVRIIKNRC